MSLGRARSAEEYAEWVKQAMFEVGDLKDCLLYEIETGEPTFPCENVGDTIVAVLSSMFWFPAPAAGDERAAEFLAMERRYVTGGWTLAKTAMTALVPAWFFLLAWAFWRRSWPAGFLVINIGMLLKVVWSFYFGGATAWSIIPAVTIGALVVNGVMLFAYRRLRRAGDS